MLRLSTLLLLLLACLIPSATPFASLAPTSPTSLIPSPRSRIPFSTPFAPLASLAPTSPTSPTSLIPSPRSRRPTLALKSSATERVESVKAAALGALASGVASAPVHYLINVFLLNPPNAIGQWEYATDMSSLSGALFAICYRYIVRASDASKPQLSQGALGAFVIVSTLPTLSVPDYCDVVPLRCELVYALDESTVRQLACAGLAAVATFLLAMAAVEGAVGRGWLKRFESF